ncbi:MAG: branched-chain amino acid ABC transporter permease [Acidobacteriota bacterium]
MDAAQLLQLGVSGIVTGGIYALIAVGFIIVYNVTGIINFAQGEFVTLGALITVSLYSNAHLSLPLAVIISIAAVTLVGVVMERLAIKPAKNASLVTFIIITIGISTAIRGAALLFWGTDSFTLPEFQRLFDIKSLGGAHISYQHQWIMVTTLLCFVGLVMFFEYTYLGKAVRACVINKNAAQLMGISPQRMSLLAFAIAGAMGALAGIVITPLTSANYDMGLMLGLKGFVAAVLGGLTSIPGALVGGIVLGLAEAFGGGLVSSGYMNAIAFLILVVILFTRPDGFFGSKGGSRV